MSAVIAYIASMFARMFVRGLSVWGLYELLKKFLYEAVPNMATLGVCNPYMDISASLNEADIHVYCRNESAYWIAVQTNSQLFKQWNFNDPNITFIVTTLEQFKETYDTCQDIKLTLSTLLYNKLAIVINDNVTQHMYSEVKNRVKQCMVEKGFNNNEAETYSTIIAQLLTPTIIREVKDPVNVRFRIVNMYRDVLYETLKKMNVKMSNILKIMTIIPSIGLLLANDMDINDLLSLEEYIALITTYEIFIPQTLRQFAQHLKDVTTILATIQECL